MTVEKGDSMSIAAQQYLETARWAEKGDERDEWDNLEWSREATDQAERDVRSFLDKCGALIDGEDITQVAHDFWLTRNRHGEGFWDGDYPEHGDRLTELAHSFGELAVYVGDDNLLYFM